MTKQEIFDVVVRGLASQNWTRSWDPNINACVCNGEDGMHCAAGWLLVHRGVEVPEEENNSVWYDMCRSLPGVRAISEDEAVHEFVADLQARHDTGGVDKMRQRFFDFGQASNLIWPADVP